ncbi:hypothetical protein [Rickettsia rickettsii]|uniref:Uncharacterized protein n=1 Tax=Rickettsia rickettsii (strain Iowa) TaxID=452659 RepID=B0BY11_RICRO|nr:hypothetical protein [Rickettsia rickettsii]ABY72737.1 hypothetical protein RrIowa_0911 [Rickettsia rickettsii str. Iowa]APU55687.1 hypothetical protein BTU50_0911 [Rickettsia rickettsii]APU57064.1 hypothetical protein BTU51_0911 [Rickettsia rickettsii]WGQ94985.1 hypothetical protein QBX69_04150 [Rickettsia rickettsii str. 'Sheila Smith']
MTPNWFSSHATTPRLQGAWQSHKAGRLRLLRQNLQFFLAMT